MDKGTKKLVEAIAYRYGLYLGKKIAKTEQKRAMMDHPNTEKLKEARRERKRLERELIYNDFAPEMRLSLRKTLETTVNNILSFDELRKKDTIEERKKVQKFSNVIKYYDELKILPMLEGMNKLKVVPDITEEEVVEAEKALQELKK